MKPAWLEIVLGLLYFLGLALGPPLFLVWKWKRWGSIRRLAIHAAGLPAIVFYLGGMTAVVVALLQSALDPVTYANSLGSSGSLLDSLINNYFFVGIYSVLFAGVFAAFWVPAVVGWRLVHPKSFWRVVRVRSTPVPSPDELDFQDDFVPNKLATIEDFIQSLQTESSDHVVSKSP